MTECHEGQIVSFLTMTSFNPTPNDYKLLRAEDVEYVSLPPEGAHMRTPTHT